MHSAMTDLTAVRAVEAHRSQRSPGAEPSSHTNRRSYTLPAKPQSRNRIASLFLSIGSHQHRHAES